MKTIIYTLGAAVVLLTIWQFFLPQTVNFLVAHNKNLRENLAQNTSFTQDIQNKILDAGVQQGAVLTALKIEELVNNPPYYAILNFTDASSTPHHLELTAVKKK